MLCCPQQPTHLQNWNRKRMHSKNFVRLGIFFHLFWGKKVENAHKFCTFGCFKKIKNNERKKNLTDPNIQKFHLRATQQFSFSGLSCTISYQLYNAANVPFIQGEGGHVQFRSFYYQCSKYNNIHVSTSWGGGGALEYLVLYTCTTRKTSKRVVFKNWTRFARIAIRGQDVPVFKKKGLF